MRPTGPLLFGVILFGGVSTPALAQSFSCDGSLNTSERLVCNFPDIAAMDSGLAAAYTAARDNLSGGQQSQLVEDERAWLARRNQCEDYDCINAAYIDRLKQLGDLQAVFSGWEGTYSSWKGLDMTITPDGPDDYKVEITGGGETWTCDGEATARVDPNSDARQLIIDGKPSALQPGGQGVFLADSVNDLFSHWCGASAPQVSGFYHRSDG